MKKKEMKKVFQTKAGSTVTIGDYTTNIQFDWLEEENGCSDCRDHEVINGMLVWDCELCGGGSAELSLVEEEVISETTK